ncbi:sodium-independent anion transporter [Stenotrophomonas sp. G106K1]|uniref:sodium-independent anion transporter n=1 Tax=Stenotrophomonas sp. G106K1 TaxID=3134792 RepID=UPI0030F47002
MGYDKNISPPLLGNPTRSGAITVEVASGIRLIDENGETTEDLTQRDQLPQGVEVFQITGPLFFGVANRLNDVLDQFRVPPKVFIIRMSLVPIVDSSGVHALATLLERCRRRGITLIISGLQTQPRTMVEQMHLHPHEGELSP